MLLQSKRDHSGRDFVFENSPDRNEMLYILAMGFESDSKQFPPLQTRPGNYFSEKCVEKKNEEIDFQKR